MPRAHFGILVPQVRAAWAETRDAVVAYEAMGYDSLWVNDHMYAPQSPDRPILEAWSTLAAIAAITDRIELGTLVTPAGLRNVGQLAKTIATVDRIAGGRVIAGLGAGWAEREFEDFGVPFLDASGRLGQLREALQVLPRLWGDEYGVTFEGKHAHLRGAMVEPKPVRRVPILVGGGGEQVTMRLAARYADVWNNLPDDQPRLAEKVAVLRQHCAEVGRDPAEVAVSQTCLVTIAEDEASARPMIERSAELFSATMGDARGPLALSGTPTQVIARIEEHLNAGCAMFHIQFFGRDPRVPAALFARTVLPHFQ